MSRYDDTIIEHAGEALSVSEWAKRLGVAAVTLWARLYLSKWPVERALMEPLQHQPWYHEGEGTTGQRLTAYRQRKAKDDAGGCPPIDPLRCPPECQKIVTNQGALWSGRELGIRTPDTLPYT